MKREKVPLGQWGEEVALKYLKRKKYKVVNKGLRLLRGEIDVIAYDKKILVFIEVKTRSSQKFGFPEESVTLSKQKQIKKLAQGYLTSHNIEDVECRFDVLSINLDENKNCFIRHIKNAF